MLHVFGKPQYQPSTSFHSESTEERKKWADSFLKTSLPRLVRISFQFQEPTEMIKKFLTTPKFSLLTFCTLPWQDKINRLDGTAASAVCCIMHKKHKKENEQYLQDEILQLRGPKKNLARIAALHK